ncbi:universal stress protein [bacterium]|nr:universal stress protein [bacterium]
MFRRVLVAYDVSSQAESAFAHGLEIAERFRAALLVVSVVRLPEPATRVELDAVIDDGKEHYEVAFARLRTAAAAKSVALRTEIQVGHPAEQIVLAAEREHADLIVMGRRGKSTIERWMLGSISERVLRYAHCPVLVVR